MKNEIHCTDMLVIGYDDNAPIPVLTVGRKTAGNEIELVNVFTSENAKTLYDILIQKPKEKNK